MVIPNRLAATAGRLRARWRAPRPYARLCLGGTLAVSLACLVLGVPAPLYGADDIEGVRQRGSLRHLAIPYSHFVTRGGDGFDVELIQRFAAHLAVRYELVLCAAEDFMATLTGEPQETDGRAGPPAQGTVPRADLGACGIGIAVARTGAVDFSIPTFPTQVWLVARAESAIRPIAATGILATDIETVKRLLAGVSVLGKSGSSLDPCLYDLERHGARVALFSGTINDLIPAVVRGDAEATLMDVPAAVDALDIWAGRIKVIGPLSPTQHMAVAFAKNSPRLRAEFDLFLAKRKADGTYLQLVRKHFPGAVERQRDFFKDCRDEAAPGANR